LGKIRVLIVDDSPFSQKVLSGALDKTVFDICAFAESGWEAVEQYRQLSPDVVTMDLTLPDMDGLACSSEIIRLDPAAKIVMVSAMKDEGLIARGYAVGVKAFLQKPPKPAELMDTIRQVCTIENETQEWQDKYLNHFVASLQDNLVSMARLECKTTVTSDNETKFASQGVAIIIGISGKQRGRMILDASQDTAVKFTQRVFGNTEVDEDDVLNSMAEFANIVCGHSASVINNIYRGTEFRLTPPSILSGKKISIVNPKLNSFIVAAETEIGVIKMSIGFAGGK